MKAQDIMTRDVVAVSPYTSVPDIAAIMVENNISGVPVLTDSGKIVGVVSQSDLLHRVEIGTEREDRRKWWLVEETKGVKRLEDKVSVGGPLKAGR